MNIRTLNKETAPTKLEQVSNEFLRYNLDILGLCEMRWTDSGEEMISARFKDEDVRLSLIFSCRPATGEWRGPSTITSSKEKFNGMVTYLRQDSSCKISIEG